jgi:osmoprotectant transport system ATP-binding protein
MAQPMIELKGVSKSFDGGRAHAVEAIDLVIGDGEFVALVGGSGSGKTTTLKMINGLVSPDAGEVRVAGEPTGAVPPHQLRRRIGYVFQEIGLFAHLTVAENIGITAKLVGQDKAAIAARVNELLDLVSLPREFASRRPAALSGGQRQRVGVARALAAKPALMLMDEPFGALDPVTRDGLGRDYRALHEQLGLTTLMVTHDITEAVLLADRMVVMDAGCIRADGTPHDLTTMPDETVRALIETPRRQAERVRERLERPAP